MAKPLLISGAIFGFLAVALGAFGAHALNAHFTAFPKLKATYQTAVEYHFYHTLALLVAAWAVQTWGSQTVVWAGYLFGLGIIIFSGSLYLLAVTNRTWLGAITPLGGLAFLGGWLCLGLGIWRSL